MDKVLASEPLAAFEAVKVLVVAVVFHYGGGLDPAVQLAIVSLVMAWLTAAQRARVWSPSSVRALAEKLAKDDG